MLNSVLLFIILQDGNKDDLQTSTKRIITKLILVLLQKLTYSSTPLVRTSIAPLSNYSALHRPQPPQNPKTNLNFSSWTDVPTQTTGKSAAVRSTLQECQQGTFCCPVPRYDRPISSQHFGLEFFHNTAQYCLSTCKINFVENNPCCLFQFNLCICMRLNSYRYAV